MKQVIPSHLRLGDGPSALSHSSTGPDRSGGPLAGLGVGVIRCWEEHYATVRTSALLNPRKLVVAAVQFRDISPPQAGAETTHTQAAKALGELIRDLRREFGRESMVIEDGQGGLLISLPGFDEHGLAPRLERVFSRYGWGLDDSAETSTGRALVTSLTVDPCEFVSARGILEKLLESRGAKPPVDDAGRFFGPSIRGETPDWARSVHAVSTCLNMARAEIRSQIQQMTRALVAAVEAKDPFTSRHSQTVAVYATILGSRLGLRPRQLAVLQQAAMLHDVGKIGVPDVILRKPHPLTDEEFAVIQRHPQTALEILHSLEGLRAAFPIILHHHERFDGRGYPAGLAEDRIPFEARILATADAVDAMRSRRCYKREYNREEVLDELRRGAGGQFDPVVARTAAQWLEEADERPRLSSERSG